ncbi:hypothetical protein [Amycolatopsis viridis]|uniref:Ig-like domain-containing protein n=1 Tax=Amycolatopsis viridis TaxID=185678 RepID=A0ABX0SQ91_9PSEU|nr:hypothetical protein [Amycolatopsis viridis]NIH79126.1 hypothetical protein [Amycolatopsis viridis]
MPAGTVAFQCVGTPEGTTFSNATDSGAADALTQCASTSTTWPAWTKSGSTLIHPHEPVLPGSGTQYRCAVALADGAANNDSPSAPVAAARTIPLRCMTIPPS